jgi:hypothetical protein
MTVPLDASQDPMPPHTVTVSDPTVTGVQPVPDDGIVQQSEESHSGSGHSGEADESSVLSRVNSERVPKNLLGGFHR